MCLDQLTFIARIHLDNTSVSHLFVHLNVEPVRHLVVLQRQQTADAIKKAVFRAQNYAHYTEGALSNCGCKMI